MSTKKNTIDRDLNFYIEKLCKTKKNRRYYLTKIRKTLRSEEKRDKDLLKKSKKYICVSKLGEEKYFNSLEDAKTYCRKKNKKYKNTWKVVLNNENRIVLYRT